MSETVLWTNPNPTSQFGYTLVTLAQSYLNFKYLRFKWKRAYTTDDFSEVLISSEEFNKMGYYRISAKNNFTIGSTTNDGHSIVRYIAPHNSDTELEISTGVYANETTGYHPYMAIPVEIVGLK